MATRKAESAADTAPAPAPHATLESPFLTAREAAAYLHLNEKKLYALARLLEIPAARVGGKWLFPRAQLDAWLLEQTHGGALTDRLLIGGCDDPLLHTALQALAAEQGSEAFVAYSPTDAVQGLALLARRRTEISVLAWGSAAFSDAQHTGLLRSHPGHARWTRIRIGLREQGVMLRAGLAIDRLETLAGFDLRWAMRAPTSGSVHFLAGALRESGFGLTDCSIVCDALDGRHAASLLVRDEADCAPGPRSLANQFGLDFIPLGHEALELVMPREIFFRRLVQRVISRLAADDMQRLAARLGGYELAGLGRVAGTA